MTNTFLQIHHHVKQHLQQHHKKYLFGIFGGFALVKLFLLVFTFGIVEYNTHHTTFADSLGEGCTLTWQYYTWEYETGWYLTGQEIIGWELTGWYLIDCVTVPWYWTGWTLNESGDLVWQTRVEESQEWCVLTGQEIIGWELTEWYRTWSYMTWWYRTGGYLIGCLSDNPSWWDTNAWWNDVCESQDITWNLPSSWSVVSNIFPITWTYSWTDCIISWLSLQLRDHNNQRIDLATWLDLWTTSYLFDSKKLYSFQQSWFYHIIWTGTSGQYYLYTGTYTWTYSRLFSWYKVRLSTSSQNTISETSPFTINNELVDLTWISLLYNWSATWYLTTNAVVNLSFTSNKPLTWLQVTLWSGKNATSSSNSWLVYTYTRTITSGYTEGPLVATIYFADALGTTGKVIYTGSLIFDQTKPVVTGFVFSGYASWVYMNFSGTEPIRYTITYQKTWWALISWSSSNYLSWQQFTFASIERDQRYVFTLTVYDRANTSSIVTGDVLQTALWTVLSHVYVVSSSTGTVLTGTSLTGTLTWLSAILKSEIGKFTTCKNALTTTPVELEFRNNTFLIHMPMFEDSQVKTLVNAFTLFILDKVKHNYSITPENITEITKKFDNFLIVLKLIRDDNNTCKQNLSTYHIAQFKKSLEEFNITLD